MTGDPLLTSAEAAREAGMTTSGWSSQVSRGAAPRADHPGDLEVPANRRNPKWRRSTVARYVASRKRPRRGSVAVEDPDTA